MNIGKGKVDPLLGNSHKYLPNQNAIAISAYIVRLIVKKIPTNSKHVIIKKLIKIRLILPAEGESYNLLSFAYDNFTFYCNSISLWDYFDSCWIS